MAREGFEPSKPLGRQIYSLLRLTASLPRQKSIRPRLPSPTLPCPAPRLLEPPDPTAIRLNERVPCDVCDLTHSGSTLARLGRGSTWSWRRDLNPRPADYKSAALPD